MKVLFVFVVVLLAVVTEAALRFDSDGHVEVPEGLIREKRQFFGGPFGGMGMMGMGMPFGGWGYGMSPWRRWGGMGMGPMMWG